MIRTGKRMVIKDYHKQHSLVPLQSFGSIIFSDQLISSGTHVHLVHSNKVMTVH